MRRPSGCRRGWARSASGSPSLYSSVLFGLAALAGRRSSTSALAHALDDQPVPRTAIAADRRRRRRRRSSRSDRVPGRVEQASNAAGARARCASYSFSAPARCCSSSASASAGRRRAGAAADRPDHRGRQGDPGHRPVPAHRPRRARTTSCASWPTPSTTCSAGIDDAFESQRQFIHEASPRAAQPARRHPHQPRRHAGRPRRDRRGPAPHRSRSSQRSTRAHDPAGRRPARLRPQGLALDRAASRSTSRALVHDAAAEFRGPGRGRRHHARRVGRAAGLLGRRRPRTRCARRWPTCWPTPSGWRRPAPPSGCAAGPRRPVGVDGGRGRGPGHRPRGPGPGVPALLARRGRRRPRARAAAGSGSRSCARSPRPTAARSSSCPSSGDGSAFAVWLPAVDAGRRRRASPRRRRRVGDRSRSPPPADPRIAVDRCRRRLGAVPSAPTVADGPSDRRALERPALRHASVRCRLGPTGTSRHATAHRHATKEPRPRERPPGTDEPPATPPTTDTDPCLAWGADAPRRAHDHAASRSRPTGAARRRRRADLPQSGHQRAARRRRPRARPAAARTGRGAEVPRRHARRRRRCSAPASSAAASSTTTPTVGRRRRHHRRRPSTVADPTPLVDGRRRRAGRRRGQGPRPERRADPDPGRPRLGRRLRRSGLILTNAHVVGGSTDGRRSASPTARTLDGHGARRRRRQRHRRRAGRRPPTTSPSPALATERRPRSGSSPSPSAAPSASTRPSPPASSAPSNRPVDSGNGDVVEHDPDRRRRSTPATPVAPSPTARARSSGSTR